MNYKVNTIPNFEKEAKKLSKKYPSLKLDLAHLISELEENPFKGVDLGGNIYKIRLAISSKGRGKSSGARVITYIKLINSTAYLVSIFDKSKTDNISKDDISKLIKRVGLK